MKEVVIDATKQNVIVLRSFQIRQIPRRNSSEDWREDSNWEDGFQVIRRLKNRYH